MNRHYHFVSFIHSEYCCFHLSWCSLLVRRLFVELLMVRLHFGESKYGFIRRQKMDWGKQKYGGKEASEVMKENQMREHGV